MRALSCGPCRACCIRESIPVDPALGDDPSAYVVEQGPYGLPLLAQKANGECYYLTPIGCSIHGKAPYRCRVFDCRSVAESLSFTEGKRAVKERRISLAVLTKGRQLLRESK